MFDIADALKNFCAEHDGQMNFYPGYSGRGMYGKKCPAIVVNDDAQPFDIALALAGFLGETEEVDPYTIHEFLGGSQMDSMGLGYVIYFPDAS